MKLFNSVLSCFCIICGLMIQESYAQVDGHCTAETRSLYIHLKQVSNQGKMLLGHQDDVYYGVGWAYVPGRSDVREVAGDYPAVLGGDLSGVELGDSLNIDHVPFQLIRQAAVEQFQAGGVVTFSWHMHNPVTGSSAWDTTGENVVAAILPGGRAHAQYVRYLQRGGAFLNSLKTSTGKQIPIILRLFHELNGNWFWWGRSHCTAAEMKALWQFTVQYLRDSLHLHHLLFAWNTDRFADADAYLERYPGDAWTDIIGFDIYQAYDIASNPAFSYQLSRMCHLLDSIAVSHDKIPALTEFGYNTIPDSSWWTQVLQPAIAPYHLAYLLAWRNAGKKPNGSQEFYVPYPGQISADDFRQFVASGRILLRRQAAMLHLYQ
ncbi:mannan endo-1,4-beta-mannosidase [Thermoflavifilum aggregans]|uniref:Mannan endo-1,4-beta-mannosidase n=2 Tax=Thermoflavifilum aggregans TaxID=454188 RepID=A0A2M9CW66_9BACT|nr:mannan endo-1,4-beta-mannosidase [Thermoflavifilum aggregans]